MPTERREGAIRVGATGNGRPEEPADFNGRRQSSVDGTSRMNREVHVRICERLGVKLPGPTRQIRTSGSVRGGGGNVPTYSALGVPNWRQVAPECGGLLQMAVRGEELQLFSAEGLLQVVQELAPEHLRQHSDWQKETRPAGNPTFAVRRDAAPRDEKMNVRVV